MSYLPGQQYVQNAAGIWTAVGYGSGNTQVPSRMTDASGVSALYRPDAVPRVAVDPTTMLVDTFEGLDTVNTWTVSGTTPPTASGGILVLAPGTAASATSVDRSQASFVASSPSWLQATIIATVDAAAKTGNKRVFGLGIPAASPTVSAPVTNGIVFEFQDATGALIGAVYSGGTRTQTVALTAPTDGAAHRYSLHYKTSRVYFEIDNLVVGSIPYPNPAVASLPIMIMSVNGAAALTTAAVLNASVMSVADTGRNNTAISDSRFPWREVQVTDPASIPGAGQAGTPNDRAWGSALNVNINSLQKLTYRVNAKPVARASTADTFLPMVAIHHLAGSSRTVRLRKVTVNGSAASAAGLTLAEVYRITAVPTGTALAAGATGGNSPRGTAGTGSYLSTDSRDANAEATVTINGSTALAVAPAGLCASGQLAFQAAAAVHAGNTEVYDWPAGEERKPLTLRAGVQEGFVIGVNSIVAMTWTTTIEFSFTEE